MKKLLLVSLCFLLLGVAQVFAQSRTVTGTVIAKEDGGPIPGVSITVKGTTIGTVTNADGKYSVNVPESSSKILVFKFIGYGTVEKPLGGGSAVNATLEISTKQLGEVLVTGALGISRTRNQQAYAAQQVTGDEVSKTRSSNFIEGLSGKISGLEIRQNNGLGASTNVIIRGSKSITNNNQALFVVDGVPFDNSNTNSANERTGRGGYDYGNAAADINPDDIESVTVLKGSAASALYGSRGANGVILITTKKPVKGLGITINSSISTGAIDKSTFPTYQNQYGGGYGKYYEDPTSQFYWRDPTQGYNYTGVAAGSKLVDPTSEDASYGAHFDPTLSVFQWDAFDPYSPNYNKATPWVAAANNPVTFYVKPISNNQSIFINSGNETSSFKVGYTRNDEKGVLPNSDVTKNSIDFGSTYKVTPKLTVGANINFTNTVGLGRYGTGYQADNPNNSFRQWWQLNNDVQELKDQYFASGGKNETWNWADPTSLTPIYWDNVYFIRYKNFESDTRNRYFGNVNANYKVTSWLNILGRVTVDNYSELQEERRALGSVGVSSYNKYVHSFNETNYDLIATADKAISESFNLKGILGTNIRKQRDQGTFAGTNGGLIVPEIYSLSNSVSAPNAPVETDFIKEVDGVFAGATITYNKFLTLDGTIRRDASSTLPEGSNVYYYPSVSGGFVFSELFKPNWLSYGKLRANYAAVGNDAPFYKTIDIYNLGTPFGSNGQASTSVTKNNPALKPESTTSGEVGIELALFGSRIGFDATYYQNRTINQIIPVTISTATGFSSEILNSGTLENKGVELSLNLTPFKSSKPDGFSWRIDANWTRNRSQVTELFKDATGQQATNLQLASYQGGVSSNATLGDAYGTLRGTDYVYYTDGQPIVKANGRYQLSTVSNAIIGNPNPNWIAGINNTIKYKNFTLSWLVDIRNGGDIFSLDLYYGLATGLYPETAGNNDLGNPLRLPIAQGGGIIRPGVLANGQPNTTRVEAYNYGAYGYRYAPDKAFIYDASYVKLREALLSYTIPQPLVAKLGPIKGVDLAVIGRNLWIIHKNLPYSDPEEALSSGNLQGYQSGAYPTVRTFTFNVKLRF
jgi:TonB-linked SusC/RagA family outer membrane protein